MLTEESARALGREWLQAWNRHDLDEIMSHYAQEVVLISPVAAKLLERPSGRVDGKEDLRAYFRKGLDTYPELRFELLDLMWGLHSVVLYYTNQRGTRTGEYMEINEAGKITKVVANYN